MLLLLEYVSVVCCCSASENPRSLSVICIPCIPGLLPINTPFVLSLPCSSAPVSCASRGSRYLPWAAAIHCHQWNKWATGFYFVWVCAIKRLCVWGGVCECVHISSCLWIVCEANCLTWVLLISVSATLTFAFFVISSLSGHTYCIHMWVISVCGQLR